MPYRLRYPGDVANIKVDSRNLRIRLHPYTPVGKGKFCRQEDRSKEVAEDRNESAVEIESKNDAEDIDNANLSEKEIIEITDPNEKQCDSVNMN